MLMRVAGCPSDPSGGASEPITSGKREAKPTVESQEARAARKAVKECQKTLWRLQLSASSGCVLYCLRLRSGVCVFIALRFKLCLRFERLRFNCVCVCGLISF